MERVRVVIVGGGPAGISTALFLVHENPSLRGGVVVLEKERYPRDKYCAGAMGARADALLGSIGARVDVPSVPIGGIAFRAMGETRVVRQAAAGRVVRRIEFDAALADCARERGIRIVEGCSVEGVDVSPSCVRVASSSGTFESDCVVGADGVGSLVRRAIGVEATPYVAQAIEVDTEPVAGDVDHDLLLFDVSDRSVPGYYWDFPTIVGGELKVCRGVYYLKSQASSNAVEIQAVLERRLAEVGLDLRRYKKKRYAERGFHRAASVSRPRALLVGEAAGIDPVTGEGIAQAIQYGAAAGRYLVRKVWEHDFQFADWAEAIRAANVGRDLLVRTLALDLFYGRHRPNVERFLLDTPEFIEVGLSHFAGRPWPRRAAMRGGWRAVRAALSAMTLKSAAASPL